MSKPSVRPRPNGPGSLRRVYPFRELPPVCFPSVWSLASPPSCTPSLHTGFPVSSLLRVLCLLGGRLFGSDSLNTGFMAAQVSLRFVTESSDHSDSNHRPSSRHTSGLFNARLTGPRFCGRPFEGQASIGLRHSLAGSPQRPAESSLLALRTDRSPPVALHPASRRRSYHWLRSSRKPPQGLSPC